MAEENPEILARAIDAAKRYLERKGFTEIGEIQDNYFHIVATDADDETLVLVKVSCSVDRLPADKFNRDKAEEAAAKIIPQVNDETSYPVRFDNIDFRILETDRALLRHHINAGGLA